MAACARDSIRQTITIVAARTESEFAAARRLFEEYHDCARCRPLFSGLLSRAGSACDVYGPPAACLLIARYEAEMVGCVGVRRRNDEECEMKRLYVVPAARGCDIRPEARRRGHRKGGCFRLSTNGAGHAGLDGSRPGFVSGSLGFRKEPLLSQSATAAFTNLELDLFGLELTERQARRASGSRPSSAPAGCRARRRCRSRPPTSAAVLYFTCMKNSTTSVALKTAIDQRGDGVAVAPRSKNAICTVRYVQNIRMPKIV